MDDRLVIDAFDRLVAGLDPDDRPGVDALRGRTLRRRHQAARRRVLGVAAAIALVVLAVAAVAWPQGDGPEDLQTQPGPTTSTTPAPVPVDADVLTIGPIPAGLAFQYCGSIDGAAQPAVYCRYDNPTVVPEVDGLTISVGLGVDDPSVPQAWEARDADAVREAILGPDPAAPPATFVRLGGVDVVSLGVTEVVPGEDLGLPDRTARSYLYVTGGASFQIGAEQVTDEQVGRVLDGLGPSPAYPGLVRDPAVLPDGAELVLQGERTRWIQPDEFDPSRSSLAPGQRYGGLYLVPGSGPLSIEVATDVDADALLDGIRLRSGVPGASGSTAVEPITVAGRRGVRLPAGSRLERGIPLDPGTPAVVVAVDERTVVQVSGSRAQEGQLEAIAAASVAELS